MTLVSAGTPAGSQPLGSAPVAPDGAAAQGEHWRPVALTIVVTVICLVLPAKYRVDPPLVVPAVLLALLAARSVLPQISPRWIRAVGDDGSPAWV